MYPKLQAALEAMLNDQGRGTDEVALTDVEFDNEAGVVVDLPAVEAVLATLTDGEIEAITIGDQDEWSTVYEKLGDAHEMVHAALDCMFNATGC